MTRNWLVFGAVAKNSSSCHLWAEQKSTSSGISSITDGSKGGIPFIVYCRCRNERSQPVSPASRILSTEAEDIPSVASLCACGFLTSYDSQNKETGAPNVEMWATRGATFNLVQTQDSEGESAGPPTCRAQCKIWPLKYPPFFLSNDNARASLRTLAYDRFSCTRKRDVPSNRLLEGHNFHSRHRQFVWLRRRAPPVHLKKGAFPPRHSGCHRSS